VKRKLIYYVVFSLVLQTTSSKAQDAGAPDSLKMVLITHPVNGINVPVVVECSVFVDSNTLSVLLFGWQWDNPLLLMDSAKASADFNAMEIGPFFFIDNAIATTNDSQVAGAAAFCLFNCFPPAAGWRRLATYYMTMRSWDTSSALMIDTVQMQGFGFTDYYFRPLFGTDYGPVWGGGISIGNFQFLCADANGDRLVNFDDVDFLINFYFYGGATPFPYSLSDLNCDGSVNIADITYLAAYINGTGAAPCCAE